MLGLMCALGLDSKLHFLTLQAASRNACCSRNNLEGQRAPGFHCSTCVIDVKQGSFNRCGDQLALFQCVSPTRLKFLQGPPMQSAFSMQLSGQAQTLVKTGKKSVSAMLLLSACSSWRAKAHLTLLPGHE